MNCKICGAEINTDDKFCTSCGSPVEQQEEIVEETKLEEESVPEAVVAEENVVAEEEKVETVVPIQAGLEKPKHDKAPFIVMGVIGVAIIAALIFLVINLTGVGSPQAQVKKAFLNTYKELLDRDEYSKAAEALMEDGLVSEKLDITVNEINVSGESLMIPMPIHFSMDAVLDGENSEMAIEMAAGLSDMKDIRLDMFMAKEGYLFGVPDLYDKYIKVDMEDVTEALGVELDMEAQMNTEATRQAMKELEKIFAEWLASAYSSVVCEKTEKVAIDTGDREINAQEYVLKMSRDDFQKYMRMLPQMLEENTVVMDWVASITSEQEAEDFIDGLQTVVEEIVPKASVQEIVLGYVDISGSKVVQIKMPIDYEAEEIREMLVIAFFGKENIGDDIRIDVNAYDEEETISMNYTMRREGNVDTIQLSVAENETDIFTLSMEGEYEVGDKACSYAVRNANLAIGEEDAADVTCSFSMNYGLEKVDSIEKPDWDSALDAMDMSEAESSEIVITILGNAIDGGYIPSEYVEAVEGMLEEISLYDIEDDFNTGDITGDDGAGMLDDSGMDYSGDIVYGSSGLPYLSCMDEDLTIELQPVDGFEFSADYSDSYTIEYEKETAEDLIVMSYSITTDTLEEHMEWEAEFQKEYYEGVGYKVELSEIQTGIINMHKTSWIEYSAEDDMGNKSQGIIAYAELDEEHGCVLDMYSLWGIDEVTVDLLYECFDLYYIEN